MKKKINVLQFICPTGFYGAERWILALAKNIDHNTVRCDLAVTQESLSQDLAIVDQYPLGENQTFKLPMNGRFDLSVVNQLVDIIKSRKIDIIHTHGYKSDIIGILAAKKSGIASVVTPHGFGKLRDWKLKLYVKLGCFSLRFFDAVVPLSRQLYTELQQMGVKKKKLSYIANGVDLSEVYSIKTDQSFVIEDQKTKRIGFIGALRQGKNVSQMLEVFNLVWLADNNVELVLVGDGDEREELELQAKGLPCYNAIKFLGFRADRLEILRSFDVFVLTSLFEGIPRCLMEALGMGVPIAAYDIPGVDQLIKHDVTGLLAPTGDIKTLASYWQRILNEDELSVRLSKNGLTFVNEKFSGVRMAREYTQLFESILINNGGK